MSCDRNRLHARVDAVSGSEVLGEEEIIDAEAAAKLDLARAEPGDDVPLEEVRRRLGR
jgi:hypothetical protein